MKTIEQIKNDVAIKHGYKDWNNIIRRAQFLFIDEVAEEHARQMCDEQIKACGKQCITTDRKYVINTPNVVKL